MLAIGSKSEPCTPVILSVTLLPIFVARLEEGGGVGGVGSFGGLGGGGLCCILIFGYKVVKLSVARYVVFQVFDG